LDQASLESRNSHFLSTLWHHYARSYHGCEMTSVNPTKLSTTVISHGNLDLTATWFGQVLELKTISMRPQVEDKLFDKAFQWDPMSNWLAKQQRAAPLENQIIALLKETYSVCPPIRLSFSRAYVITYLSDHHEADCMRHLTTRDTRPLPIVLEFDQERCTFLSKH
jgi:hypothetical protein